MLFYTWSYVTSSSFPRRLSCATVTSSWIQLFAGDNFWQHLSISWFHRCTSPLFLLKGIYPDVVISNIVLTLSKQHGDRVWHILHWKRISQKFDHSSLISSCEGFYQIWQICIKNIPFNTDCLYFAMNTSFSCVLKKTAALQVIQTSTNNSTEV